MDTLFNGDIIWHIGTECFFVGEIVYETFTNSEQYIVKPTTIFVDNRYSLDVNRPTHGSFSRKDLHTEKEFNKIISSKKRKAIRFLFWAKWI